MCGSKSRQDLVTRLLILLRLQDPMTLDVLLFGSPGSCLPPSAPRQPAGAAAARHSAGQRACGWCWTGVAGWGSAAPQKPGAVDKMIGATNVEAMQRHGLDKQLQPSMTRREGKVGGWKRRCTVAQSARVDEALDKPYACTASIGTTRSEL